MLERGDAYTAINENEVCKALFDMSGEGILVLATEGRQTGCILAVNQACADMHGYTPEELTGLYISKLDAPEAVGSLHERFEHILQHGSDSDEIMAKRKDGTQFWIHYHAHLLELEGHKLIVSFSRDITPMKQTVEQLQTCQERLDALI